MIDTRKKHCKPMRPSVKKLLNTLNKQGYVTVCNNVLSSILREDSGVYEGKCFIVTEGFTNHFINTIDGARTLYGELIKQQKNEYKHRECRKTMNRIALAQINTIIDCMQKGGSI